MADLQEIYRAVDHLTDEEKEQLRMYLDRQKENLPITDEDTETKIAKLHHALEHFWEGIPPEEIDQIVAEMNSEGNLPLQVQDDINQWQELRQIAHEDVQTKIAAIHKAFAEIREGMTQEELDEMIAVMNSEYIEPLDPDEFAWLDEDESDKN